MERLPTHSGKKPKPLQCPTEPYMSCRSYLSDFISFCSLPCVFCYSHIGLLAGFLTSQSHSCLNISSEPLEASLAGHVLISDLSSLGHAQISLHQRPPYRKQHTPPQWLSVSLTLPYFCFLLLSPPIPFWYVLYLFTFAYCLFLFSFHRSSMRSGTWFVLVNALYLTGLE